MYYGGQGGMPANASSKNLTPQDAVRSQRNEAWNAQHAQDDNPRVMVKEKKTMGGKEKSEIRVSGIRLDRNQMIEVENKQENTCGC